MQHSNLAGSTGNYDIRMKEQGRSGQECPLFVFAETKIVGLC